MNTQDDPSQFFKQKRDEYLVEIRKKKNTDHIRAKRTKLALHGTEPQGNEPNALPTILPLEQLAPAFIQNCNSGNLAELPNLAEQIRCLVSQDDNPPVTELIHSGAVPYILEFLKPQFYQEEKLIVECSWIANNIASKELEHVDYLVGLNILPKVIELLDHPSQEVKENALMIIANIAGESLDYRDDLIKAGVVFKLDALLEANTIAPTLMGTVAWAMSNLCRGKPYPEFFELIPFLKYIENFIKNAQDDETLMNAVWCLAYLTDGDENQIQEILDLDNLDDIIKLFRLYNDKLKAPLLRFVGNVTTGTDEQTDMLVSRGIVEALYPLLFDEKKMIRKETCWAYSNLLGGTQSQIEQVFTYANGKVIDKLMVMIQQDDKYIAEECIHALVNACDGGNMDVIRSLVDRGLIDLLVVVLENPSSQVKILKACLGAIDNILKKSKLMYMGTPIDDNPYYIKLLESGGLARIEKLQNHSNMNVFKLIEKILGRIDENSM